MLYMLLMLVVFACKPADRSQSEGKFANQLRKSVDALTKTQKLANKRVVKDAVKKAVDEGELDDLKKILKKGDKLSDAASLAYYRVFQEKQKSFIKEVNFQLSRIHHMWSNFGEKTSTVSPDFVEDLIVYMKLTTKQLWDHSSLLERKILQEDDLIKSLSSQQPKFDFVFGLCCRKSTLPEPVSKSSRTLSIVLDEEFIPVTVTMKKLSSMKESMTIGPEGYLVHKDLLDQHKIALSELSLAKSGLLKDVADYKKILVKAVEDQ